MAEFMEDNVLVKWTELRNQRRKIETRVKHSHEVRIEKYCNNVFKGSKVAETVLELVASSN